MIVHPRGTALAVTLISAVLGATALVSPAQATPVAPGPAHAVAPSRDGACDPGEFCYYYYSNYAGSLSDFAKSLGNYGASLPRCYVFNGQGDGKGKCVKNAAASAWNRTNKTVRVYYRSNFGGTSQDIGPGQGSNLNASLKNNNASHQLLG